MTRSSGWLDGGPGYASGPIRQEGEIHQAEDEYLMTGTACLLGLAEYLEHAGTPEWLARYHTPIRRQLDAMRARDVDDDGLVESSYRTGVSGTGQWEHVLVRCGQLWMERRVLERHPLPSPRSAVERLSPARRARPCRRAGGLGRPAQGQLHTDVLQPGNRVVGGLAMQRGPPPRSRLPRTQRRCSLWWTPRRRAGAAGDAAALERKPPRANAGPYLGLPGNLWAIPDEDLADIMEGYPLGYYQNGGRTHSQSRHFVGALYRVDMTREADYLLSRLCKGLGDAAVFGGNGSGLDWRYWDGRPCGYEGLLTDQFGILAVALDRYGADIPVPAE